MQFLEEHDRLLAVYIEFSERGALYMQTFGKLDRFIRIIFRFVGTDARYIFADVEETQSLYSKNISYFRNRLALIPGHVRRLFRLRCGPDMDQT